MQTQISIFKFQADQSVRVEYKNGEPLFCLTDVAEILLIKNANPTRFNMKTDGVHKMYSVDSKGRKNEITFINEPNLYRVIFRSNKPEAVKFQDWIFEEVIPQIRKTGKYESRLKVLLNNNTVEARRGLVAAVKQLAKAKSVDYSDAYRMVHQRFNVESIEQLSYEQIAQATEYVHHLILDKSLSGEVLDKEPNLSHGSIILSSYEVSELTYMLKHLPYLDAYYHRTASSVRNLNSHMIYVVHDRFSHCCLHAKHLASSLGLSIQSWNDVIGELG
ncbi:BRO-N domain-containing protein [Kingella negevensis]|uniref:BRO-N domain-containing protein n=1 Tax=Kingella negevensis TaxID=1522312 RepID=UPI00254E21B0|nr:BRO family protein [Kingella negevensis]MDK4689677.1 BRO family protein [Kingella negevensis]